MMDERMIPCREYSEIYKTLKEFKCEDRYNMALKKGDWFRMSNLVFDCLFLMNLSAAEMKLFLWIYRNTVAWHQDRIKIPEAKTLAYECGISVSSLYTARDKLLSKRMIHGFDDYSRKNRRTETYLKTNNLPDLWENNEEVREYCKKWLVNFTKKQKDHRPKRYRKYT